MRELHPNTSFFTGTIVALLNVEKNSRTQILVILFHYYMAFSGSGLDEANPEI